MQNASHNRASGWKFSEPFTFDDCLKLCDTIGFLISKPSSDDACASSPLPRLFDFFAERLHVADISMVADHLLEILSILAMQGDCRILKKLVDLSWTSLHTIYAHTGTGTSECGRLPCALAASARQCELKATSRDQCSLRRVFDRTVFKLNRRDKNDLPDLTLMRRGMLRHWGLLLVSTSTFTFQKNQLLIMIAELASLLESVDGRAARKLDDGKSDSEISSTRKKKSIHAPSIIGLDAATFPVFFEMLIHIVVATAATLNARLLGSSHGSPYHHLSESFGLFRRLIELYQRHISIFPRKSVFSISNASKEVLSVAVAHLQRCVEWRSAQPLLSIREREAGKYDPGAIIFLEQFIDAVSSHTAGTVLSLCDFWQSREGAHFNLPRSTTLRFAAEKAARRMSDVSTAHNLVPPSFGVEIETIEVDDTLQLTKGFHQIEQTQGLRDKCRICPTRINSKIESKSTESRRVSRLRIVDEDELLFRDETDSDTDASFGAAGDWGDDSEDDKSGRSLNLHSNVPVIRE